MSLFICSVAVENFQLLLEKRMSAQKLSAFDSERICLHLVIMMTQELMMIGRHI